MSKLQVIEREGQRVLTTQQLAEIYQTDTKTLNKNFERNRDKYTEGKHYISLSGDELKEFKGSRQNDDTLKFVSILYLWTEKGAWLHAKSLNTDRAWEAYETLVDEYYRIKSEIQPKLPQSYAEALRELAATWEREQNLLLENQTMKPKAEMYDTILTANNCQDMGEVAKVFGLGRNTLFKKLREHKVIMSNGTLPYQRYIDQGYFEVIEVNKQNGEFNANFSKAMVTAKGIDFIGKILKLQVVI